MTVAVKSPGGVSESRRRGLLVIALVGLLLVPAAIAWACGPNRAIQTDRTIYAPGQTVNVTGANFEVGASIQIKVNGGTVASTTVSSTGNIGASFAAPTAPGTYGVRTDGVDQDGQALAGTGNTVTISVAAQTPPPSGGGGPGSTPGASSPGSGNASAPGTTSGGGQGGRAGDNSRSVAGGNGVRSPANGGGGGGGGVNTTEGTIATQGTTAFAGSVSRAARITAADNAAKGGKKTAAAARPSERSAAADLWSGLTSSKNPSLLPAADGQSVSGPDTGPGLAWALGLLGLGSAALLGLGLAEAQRRRKAPTR